MLPKVLWWVAARDSAPASSATTRTGRRTESAAVQSDSSLRGSSCCNELGNLALRVQETEGFRLLDMMRKADLWWIVQGSSTD